MPRSVTWAPNRTFGCVKITRFDWQKHIDDYDKASVVIYWIRFTHRRALCGYALIMDTFGRYMGMLIPSRLVYLLYLPAAVEAHWAVLYLSMAPYPCLQFHDGGPADNTPIPENKKILTTLWWGRFSWTITVILSWGIIHVCINFWITSHLRTFQHLYVKMIHTLTGQ
jgi:hypothetical protein